jgi:hypothetical protein
MSDATEPSERTTTAARTWGCISAFLKGITGAAIAAIIAGVLYAWLCEFSQFLLATACSHEFIEQAGLAWIVFIVIMYPSHGSRWSRKRRRELPKAGWRHERNGLIEFGAGARVR